MVEKIKVIRRGKDELEAIKELLIEKNILTAQEISNKRASRGV